MPHKTTIRTNGQTLTVNASVSHWTSEALALAASGDDDVASTTTTTITSDYDLWFANTATTATITVKQLDGTTLGTYANLQVNPGVGTRTLNPLPDPFQTAADLNKQASLLPSGVLAETVPRVSSVIGTGTVLSTGRLSMAAISLPQGLAVTSITFWSGGTAVDTATHQWFALYNSSRELLGQTTNDTSTAWGTNAAKTLALTTPYTTTYSGLHYLGINVTATTVPALMAVVVSSQIHGVAPILNGTSTTGLTDTAPATADALTVTTRIPYAYVS